MSNGQTPDPAVNLVREEMRVFGADNVKKTGLFIDELPRHQQDEASRSLLDPEKHLGAMATLNRQREVSELGRRGYASVEEYLQGSRGMPEFHQRRRELTSPEVMQAVHEYVDTEGRRRRGG